MLALRPFQRRAVRAFEGGRFDTVVLCLPRAQGKSTLAADLCRRALTPDDPLFRPGTESHLVASTIGQARRTCFKILRQMIEGGPDALDYRISESPNSCSVRHVASNTRVSVIAASGKATLGLVGCPYVIADEPGSWEIDAGAAVWDALATALGKPLSPLRLFCIGHLAPKATAAGHWYFDLVHKGTRGRTWVAFLQADPAKWERASEIRRCSPLSWRFPASRAKLLEERDDAISDTAAKAAFWSYRLNIPTEDAAAVLLTVEDFQLIGARDVPPRVGRPIVGIDLGMNRAWSAAVAVWVNGRVEAVAVTPGIPDVAKQERRDRVPKGTYQALVDAGILHVADGLRVPTAAHVAKLIRPWRARAIYLDRFRADELLDCGVQHLHARATRWSDSSADIRGLRKLARDGPLAIAPESVALVRASLAVARVQNQEGNIRLLKRGTNNQARDDVAAALVLAAGGVARRPVRRGKVRARVVAA